MPEPDPAGSPQHWGAEVFTVDLRGRYEHYDYDAIMTNFFAESTTPTTELTEPLDTTVEGVATTFQQLLEHGQTVAHDAIPTPTDFHTQDISPENYMHLNTDADLVNHNDYLSFWWGMHYSNYDQELF